jgi:hypothetical protein
MNNPDCIDNDEELYRRIELNELNTKTPPHYIVKASGEIKIESAAFLGGERPSVNRAKLKCKPEDTKKNVTDGIISVTAEDVRSISIQDYTTDVEHVPLENNDAHSEIVLNSNRNGVSKGAFSKFRRGLADIAVCKIKPTAVK